MTEGELLFTELLNCPLHQLYLNKGRILTQKETPFVADALKRRFRGEPIQYILGKTEFMGLEFIVTPEVFIPRPETEILVEAAIDIVKLLNCHIVKLLDTGTGSGNIAISLAKFLPDTRLTATEISEKALEIAKKNASLNNVEKRISFICCNLFTYNLSPKTYDLIVCNPPYIPAAEIKNLQPELGYEPRIALDGGEDGLDFYRRIINQAFVYLKRGGFLILEMGYNQCSAIKELFNSTGKFNILEVLKDYNNFDRVIVTQKNKRVLGY